MGKELVMKWVVLGLAVAVAAAFVFARGGAAKGYEKRAMTVAEMTASGGLIVDIRTPLEWKDTGVIAGAQLVTFGDANSFLTLVRKDIAEGRPVILICRSGARSSAAAAALAGKIANPIISVNGGMSSVIAAGYQTVKPK